MRSTAVLFSVDFGFGFRSVWGLGRVAAALLDSQHDKTAWMNMMHSSTGMLLVRAQVRMIEVRVRNLSRGNILRVD